MSEALVTTLAGLVIVAGVVGAVLPFLPGLWLSWVGVLFWAIFANGGGGKWTAFAIATAVTGFGLLLKYLIPGARMRERGVSTASILAGGLLAILGFFLIPVVGLVLGFVGGVYLAELLRQSDPARAWASAWQALTAVGLSLLIELGAALFVLVIWGLGVLLT